MSERQEDGEQTVENEEECLVRHRKEKKELQGIWTDAILVM